MELFKASNQWSTRPDDERFDSLPELHAAVSSYRADAREVTVPFNSLRVEARGSEVMLVGKANTPARLTNHAFGQIGTAVGAPVAWCREVDPTLAAQNINFGLARTADRSDRHLLLHTNGDLLARAITSEKYARVWNSDITQRLLHLPEQGWRVPPARPVRDGQKGTRLATEADVLDASSNFGLSIKVGDPIAPAGLYASDHDLFVFMINESRRISEPGNPDGLSRGFMAGNSEVGGKSFWLLRFLYRNVCGNHIVWGASQVSEIRIPHIGNADERVFNKIRLELIKYADESASDDEARIRTAASFVLGATKDEVLDRLFGVKSLRVSRKTLSDAYDITVTEEPNVDPTSAWGMAQGLTRLSQATPYADERVERDRAAGRVLAMAF